MQFSAAIYRGSAPHRWAVYSHPSRTWLFPTKTGKRAAECYATTLNRPETTKS